MADQAMALDILENAKCSRPSVCNACEVCLVDAAIAREFLPKLHARLTQDRAQHPVELRLDQAAQAIIPGTPAGEADFDTEFLDYILAVKVVDGVQEAVDHIAAHSTGHSEAILTADEAAARAFLGQVDSAAVYWNASTRFTDGGSSAWAVRWAFPPKSSTPGAPWAWGAVLLQVRGAGHGPDPADPWISQ